jgi:hypothetical protein
MEAGCECEECEKIYRAPERCEPASCKLIVPKELLNDLNRCRADPRGARTIREKA